MFVWVHGTNKFLSTNAKAYRFFGVPNFDFDPKQNSLLDPWTQTKIETDLRKIWTYFFILWKVNLCSFRTLTYGALYGALSMNILGIVGSIGKTSFFLYFSLDFEFQNFGGLRWGSVGSSFLYSVNTIDLSFLLNKKSCPNIKNWPRCLKWKCSNAFLSKSARADRFSEARISNPSSKNTLHGFRNFKRRFKTM